MKTQQNLRVAILLATYNGAQFVDAQIESLQNNATCFELHWLDDHSSDDTRAAVRNAAARAGIAIFEWHQQEHLGVPAAFFRLVECVEADIYLFCDQDDIWQPGKIDATVSSLLPELATPALAFSDPLVFRDGDLLRGIEPHALQHLSDIFENAKAPRSLEESRLFMSACCCGNTAGFTRPLREIFVRHKDVARTHAAMHDSWMYLIATASGTVRMLSDVPTTLFRRHGRNFTEFFLDPKENWLTRTWKLQQVFRSYIARQAEGFILAAETLPPSQKRERLLALARLVATLKRRQSPAALLRLIRSGAMWPSRRSTVWFTASCLWSTVRW